MRVAYADPPYIGQGARYEEKTEVDHNELIMRLAHDYDCWALSASSPSLKEVIPLCNKLNVPYRIGAWVKPFCSFKPNVNPAYAWEPVIFYGERQRPRSYRTVRDWISANITLKKGLVGAKPPEFCFWLFELLGLWLDDELYDLYPGTGIVTQMWETWKWYQNWLEFESKEPSNPEAEQSGL